LASDTQLTQKKQLRTTRALPAAYLREVFESEEAKKWDFVPLGKLVDEFRYGTSNKSTSF
jgi:hypothetical protein